VAGPANSVAYPAYTEPVLIDFDNSDDLARLEALLTEFNIFEAAGLTNQEIRHSRFLAFLLNPKESHGIGDAFVKRILQVVTKAEKSLTDIDVSCETKSIDILMLSSANKLAVIIENKIGIAEHSGQLQRYMHEVEKMRPGWEIVAVLLSPDGTAPTDERYIALSYEEVAIVLGEVIANCAMNPDVQLVASHYVRLLRRHVVSDAQLNQLCDQIIAKHRKALELLVDRMGDPKTLLWQVTDEIMTELGMVRSKTHWLPESWREWVPRHEMKDGDYVLAFWVDVWREPVRLILSICEGPEHFRQKTFDAALANKPLFSPSYKKLYKRNRIFEVELTPTRVPGEISQEEWIEEMKRRIPGIEALLAQLEPILSDRSGA
jgi:hypothetical protein